MKSNPIKPKLFIYTTSKGCCFKAICPDDVPVFVANKFKELKDVVSQAAIEVKEKPEDTFGEIKIVLSRQKHLNYTLAIDWSVRKNSSSTQIDITRTLFENL